MQIIGFFLVILGTIFLVAPEFIAYFLGIILILIGGNLLLLSYGIQRSAKKESPPSFQFGDYEISRKRK